MKAKFSEFKLTPLMFAVKISQKLPNGICAEKFMYFLHLETVTVFLTITTVRIFFFLYITMKVKLIFFCLQKLNHSYKYKSTMVGESRAKWQKKFNLKLASIKLS